MTREIHLPGLPAVPLRRHARAKRVSLRYCRETGKVWLVAPTTASQPLLRQVVEEERQWILDRTSRPVDRVPFDLGAEIPIEGTFRRIARGDVASPDLRASELLLPANADPAARTASFLKALCRERIEAVLPTYLERLKPHLQPSHVRIKDLRTRWGSCSSKGGLNFNWRLILAPAYVLEYVVAHEVTHLVHMNHSARFWTALREIEPRTRSAESWLNSQGRRLGRYGPPSA
ncbi:hypothetical protein CKO28_00930 [Rhodovibrio sodomensis]|uniref:YgjP-like metallopeptidase domain-containing protein n=1 Tax=Rhodovibrio sodomensis TaxID=1088 RepID=A0ABS1D9N4_9PROT|nr:SprT family zinc-dependent metalloprotease [Rhodovibrio sodomensis]MBK1666606.1 hypothetical protein [Rhodovibrio sodomensis]